MCEQREQNTTKGNGRDMPDKQRWLKHIKTGGLPIEVRDHIPTGRLRFRLLNSGEIDWNAPKSYTLGCPFLGGRAKMVDSC